MTSRRFALALVALSFLLPACGGAVAQDPAGAAGEPLPDVAAVDPTPALPPAWLAPEEPPQPPLGGAWHAGPLMPAICAAAHACPDPRAWARRVLVEMSLTVDTCDANPGFLEPYLSHEAQATVTDELDRDPCTTVTIRPPGYTP